MTLALSNQVYERATCLYSTKAIEQALDNMATKLQQDLKEKNPIVLCVMIGGVIATGQLLTRLNFPLQLDYIHATRYADKTVGEQVQWLVKPRLALAGRVVLIIDDILDKGVTLAQLCQYCHQANAAEVFTGVLVNKKIPRASSALQQVDYSGVDIGDQFLFGYGMDYKRYLRNAPGIYAVADQDR